MTPREEARRIMYLAEQDLAYFGGRLAEGAPADDAALLALARCLAELTRAARLLRPGFNVTLIAGTNGFHGMDGGQHGNEQDQGQEQEQE